MLFIFLTSPTVDFLFVKVESQFADVLLLSLCNGILSVALPPSGGGKGRSCPQLFTVFLPSAVFQMGSFWPRLALAFAMMSLVFAGEFPDQMR